VSKQVAATACRIPRAPVIRLRNRKAFRRRDARQMLDDSEVLLSVLQEW
jgi:hypothetical protein